METTAEGYKLLEEPIAATVTANNTCFSFVKLENENYVPEEEVYENYPETVQPAYLKFPAVNFDFRTINGLGVSKEVAGGLALCLGSLGAHYFYCRKYTAGLIFLAISILSCGFLAIISVVISVIQGILILTKDIDYLLITFVNNDKKLPLF